MTESFGFDVALLHIKRHVPVKRLAWQGLAWVVLIGGNQWVAAGMDDSTKLAGQPFILMMIGGKCEPWTPLHVDLLAEDWVLA